MTAAAHAGAANDGGWRRQSRRVVSGKAGKKLRAGDAAASAGPHPQSLYLHVICRRDGRQYWPAFCRAGTVTAALRRVPDPQDAAAAAVAASLRQAPDPRDAAAAVAAGASVSAPDPRDVAAAVAARA